MHFLTFILTYPLIWFLSKLPMRFLYVFSDFLFVLIYYIFGYRKKVVLKNLQLAFPKKSEKELKKISKKFYHHFVDLLVESVKFFSISEKEIKKRYVYKNPELVNKLATKTGKSIMIVGAHQANWEWSVSMPLAIEITVLGAYTRLGNKYFEKVVRTSRMRFGIDGFKTSETVKGIQKVIDKGIQAVYILLSDQSARVKKTCYWQKFFGVTVPVHTGAEMLAKKFDMPVVNYVAKKIKRGYYEIYFELITACPKDFNNYEITDKYLKITEQNIKQQPEFYLWTHRRFKHKDKAPN